MFYLGGSDFPATREQMVAAVVDGLRGFLTLPAGREVVKIEGGNFPAFDRVVVDLTAARFDSDRLPPEPKGTGQKRPGPFAVRMEVIGRPFYLRQAAVDLALSASEAQFEFDRDAAGRPVLLLNKARDGRVTIQIRKNDVDMLVLTAAKEGAAEHGVQIIEAQTTLTQLDPRSVSADVRIKAKKMFLTAIVHLRGKLSIDDAMNAKVFDTSCTGEGMLGDLASGLLRPHLKKVEGQTFPLTAVSLGQVRVRDLTMQIGDMMKVTAAFGS